MKRNELNDEEYRKLVRRENMKFYLRVIIFLILFAVFVATEIGFGMYLKDNGFSTTRIVIVSIAWFFVFFITTLMLILSIAFCYSMVESVVKTGERLSKSDKWMVLYFIGMTILLGGGAQVLFWLFAFK